jgi:hypothetical protein
VEDFLAKSMPIEAKRSVVVSMGHFSGCCGIVFEDYSRGGSSRSVPLTDMDVAAMVEPTVTEKSSPKQVSKFSGCGRLYRSGGPSCRARRR